MKRIILYLAGIVFVLFLLTSGLFMYWKYTVFAKENGVPIFCYHKISNDNDLMSIKPERFQSQLAELKKMGYYTIHLEDAYQYWQRGEKIAPGALVITFDDGYQDNFSQAEPILEKMGAEATAFIIVNRQIQWDFMDWDEVRGLQKAGWEMGSHSWSHFDLSIRPDYHGELEIRKSRLEIEKRSGGRAYWFAYPYGYWNKETAQWVEKSGYHGAVTTRFGIASPADGYYSLDRIGIIPNFLPAALDVRLRIFKAELAEFRRWLKL